MSVKAKTKVYFAQGDQFIFDDTCRSAHPDVKKLHGLMKEMSRVSYLIPGMKFIANSRTLAHAVESRYGRKADALLPVCVDLDSYRPFAKTSPGGTPKILIVGPDSRGSELEPLGFKGIEDARDGLEILRRDGMAFSVVRMSNTPPDFFKGFPCEFHVAPSVEVKQRLFGTADILVYSSHYDSCPRPPLEAMAAGAAVVCTATEGAREYCRDDENALLVPIRCPEQIAVAVRRLLQEPGLTSRLVLGGRTTACMYPQEREWDELEAILYKFSGKRRMNIIRREARLQEHAGV